jgi:nicotinamide phosphoribosyltransferase
MARSDKTFDKVSFFGLQYYLKEYLSVKLTPEMGEHFIQTQEGIFGKCSELVKSNIRSLCKLGYYPIEIKAVKEGSIIPAKNALMSITNTLPEFYWVPGFIESLLLKIWYPCTVASASFKYREIMEKYWKQTASDSIQGLKPFLVHDFGFRSACSEESAALSGVAHLTNFMGSDTIPARGFAIEYYNAKDPILLSAMASEHSCMCSYGRENEFQAFERMLELYPDGIVSVVSDTFDIYNVLTNFLPRLKEKILTRDGVYVTRPDSGNPEYILCGDPNQPNDSPEGKGAIRLLDEIFGSSINEKGYKQLNPKVGILYGDGIFLERYEAILNRLMKMGYASSNLVIGVGALLRYFSRDSQGHALKATYVEINGEPREIEKDPITDHKKKSHKGLIQLFRHPNGTYETRDQVSWEEEKQGELQTVFKDGQITKEFTLGEIRERVNTYFEVKNG